jgi:hypothetical protein
MRGDAMAERIRPDRDHLERAPEETAIESWVEDLGIYLMIPGGETTRQRMVGRRLPITSAGRGE